jgi:hypothetical protein
VAPDAILDRSQASLGHDRRSRSTSGYRGGLHADGASRLQPGTASPPRSPTGPNRGAPTTSGGSPRSPGRGRRLRLTASNARRDGTGSAAIRRANRRATSHGRRLHQAWHRRGRMPPRPVPGRRQAAHDNKASQATPSDARAYVLPISRRQRRAALALVPRQYPGCPRRYGAAGDSPTADSSRRQRRHAASWFGWKARILKSSGQRSQASSAGETRRGRLRSAPRLPASRIPSLRLTGDGR